MGESPVGGDGCRAHDDIVVEAGLRWAVKMTMTVCAGEAEVASQQKGIAADAGAALNDRAVEADDGEAETSASSARLLDGGKASSKADQIGPLEVERAMESLNLVAALLLDQSRREDDLRRQIRQNSQSLQQASSSHADEVLKLRKELEEKDVEIQRLKEDAERQASLVSSMHQEQDDRLQLQGNLNVSEKAAREAATLLDRIEQSIEALAEVAARSASGATSLSARLRKAENKCSQSNEISKELQAVIAKMHKLDG